MLADNQHSCSSESTSEDIAGASDARRQYTLKGVEAEAIDLMRKAASAQGMKIGHWVSDRLKEAAQKALSDTDRQRDVLNRLVQRSEDVAYNSELSLKESVSVNSVDVDARITRLELELRDVLKSQRDLMNLIIMKMI